MSISEGPRCSKCHKAWLWPKNRNIVAFAEDQPSLKYLGLSNVPYNPSLLLLFYFSGSRVQSGSSLALDGKKFLFLLCFGTLAGLKTHCFKSTLEFP